jgi:hypothetical protein
MLPCHGRNNILEALVLEGRFVCAKYIGAFVSVDSEALAIVCFEGASAEKVAPKEKNQAQG